MYNSYKAQLINGEKWVYGSIFYQVDNHEKDSNNKDKFYIIEDNEGENNTIILKNRVKKETISRFIGILDSNGNRIFENDIIDFRDKLYKVFFNGETLSYELFDINSDVKDVNHLINTIPANEILVEYVIASNPYAVVVGDAFMSKFAQNKDNIEYNLHNFNEF